jgi:hypothetical protein
MIPITVLRKIPMRFKDNCRYIAFLFLLFVFSNLSYAAPYYGANFSYAARSSEPEHLHGYQLMLNYDPDRFKWRKFNVYFDGGFSHFYVNKSYNSTINIYSVAPVIRYTFHRRGPVLPYLELSIGLSYLNHTRIEHRNLGIHFAFQDRMGIGALLGTSEKVSIGVHAVHYSNAHLSSKNSGITIPLVLDVGYRFQ